MSVGGRGLRGILAARIRAMHFGGGDCSIFGYGIWGQGNFNFDGRVEIAAAVGDEKDADDGDDSE